MMKKLKELLLLRKNWTIPYVLFLALFVVIPMVLILLYAFTTTDGEFTMDNFVRFISHKEELYTLIYSIGIAIITTGVCILVGYPVALILSSKTFKSSELIIMLFILPMWINVLIRTLATVSLFDFLKLPLGEGALIFGMVYNFLPFMIYPIYNNLVAMDKTLIEAAQDLGAKETTIFSQIIFPLSMPGVVSGVMMVFMPTISTFAIAELLTMNNIKLFGTTIQENLNNGLWNYSAALSLIMLLFIGATMLSSNKKEGDSKSEGVI
ncbi:MAG: ABC transporter permease [Rikenellaceae bacterium]